MKEVKFSEVSEGMPFIMQDMWMLKSKDLSLGANSKSVGQDWHVSENEIVQIPDTELTKFSGQCSCGNPIGEPQQDWNGWTPVFREMECYEPVTCEWKVALVAFKKGTAGVVEQEGGHIWFPKRIREFESPEQKLEREARKFADDEQPSWSQGWKFAYETYLKAHKAIAGAKRNEG